MENFKAMDLKRGPTEWRSGPFGSPDASRTRSSDIYFPVPGAAPDIENMNRPLHERVVIGKKGAGKTLYLRSLQEHFGVFSDHGKSKKTNTSVARHDGWLIFREINRLSSGTLIELSHTLNRAHAYLISKNVYVDQKNRSRELWTQIWSRAVEAAVYNLIFGKVAHRDYESARELATRDRVLAQKRDYVREFLADLPPTISLTSIIKFFSSKKSDKIGSIQKYLDADEWDQLSELLDGVINQGPQTAIFIDAIDEDFDEAPNAWLDCQEGLFRCIFGILNKANNFSNRLHIIVALREIVYASLLKSEHANRYLQDEHVRYIAWESGPARTLLFNKISTLRDTPLAHPDADAAKQPMYYWLGVDRIENRSRSIIEPVADYILRHTRLLPRDIVLMGNAICEEQKRRAAEGQDFGEKQVRKVVHEVSKFICLSAVRSSLSEHLCSDDYMAEALLDEYPDESVVERSSEEDVKRIAFVKNRIESAQVARASRFFQLIGKEVFTREEMLGALVESELVTKQELADVDRDAFFRFDNILYRHGLIAYESNRGGTRRWRFCWRGAPVVESATLPTGNVRYGFHSSVLDAYDFVVAEGDQPVA